jgi:hypothetical protein
VLKEEIKRPRHPLCIPFPFHHSLTFSFWRYVIYVVQKEKCNKEKEILFLFIWMGDRQDAVIMAEALQQAHSPVCPQRTNHSL